MTQGGTGDQTVVKPPRDYESIRDLLLEKSPREIRHELPTLIETIADTEESDADRFVLGVSFTTHGTCFDFWMDRVEETPHEVSPHVEELKAPVNPDHPYVTFTYPPDSMFDAATLRGCLLSTVEQRLADVETDVTDEKPPGGFSRFLAPIKRVLPF